MGGITRRVQMTMALSLGLDLGACWRWAPRWRATPAGADLLNLDQSTHIASWVDR